MSVKIFKAFLVIVLLSLPTSGQNTQQHLICKNVENVFSDGHDDSPVSHQRRIQVRQGKRGPPGIKGERGLPGVQGIPGSPAIVDYERIFQVIEEKHREAMREIESRFEELQRNFTQQNAGQRCEEENALSYEGNCFFMPHLSHSWDLNYNQAVERCTSRNSLIAELHSRAHHKAIQDFFRPRIPSSIGYIYLWIGMTYQSSERNLRYRSGKEVSVDQFEWHSASYPKGSGDKIMMEIKLVGYEGLRNRVPTESWHGVICEKPL